MTNNPRMPFYHDGAEWDGNKHYKLEMLIRASTAAPFLFTPTEITIHTDRFGNTTRGWFVDGRLAAQQSRPAHADDGGNAVLQLNWTCPRMTCL